MDHFSASHVLCISDEPTTEWLICCHVAIDLPCAGTGCCCLSPWEWNINLMLSAFITQPIVRAAKGNWQSSKIMSVGGEIHFSPGMTPPASLLQLTCLWISGDGRKTLKCLWASPMSASVGAPVSAFDSDSQHQGELWLSASCIAVLQFKKIPDFVMFPSIFLQQKTCLNKEHTMPRRTLRNTTRDFSQYSKVKIQFCATPWGREVF